MRSTLNTGAGDLAGKASVEWSEEQALLPPLPFDLSQQSEPITVYASKRLRPITWELSTWSDQCAVVVSKDGNLQLAHSASLHIRQSKSM